MHPRRLLPLATAVVLLAPDLALAQGEGIPELPQEVIAPVAPLPPGVETIEVIGESENGADVQDEAQAITAFSAEDLDRANIVNIDSLAIGVPGLHVGQSGQEAIVTLRGIGTENASITGEPGVAFHVDGVNYAQPASARVAFFDLETLDVKLGPQGLAGGKNSTSGTINVITRKPTDEYEIQGDITFGNYDRVRAKGAINVPLAEFGAARLALYHETRDGYLDNVFVSDSRDPFDVDDFGLRGHLRLNPAESVEVLLSYNYFHQGGNGPQADLVPIPRDFIRCNPTTAPNKITLDAPPGGNAAPSVMPIRARCNFETIQTGGTSYVLDPVTGKPIIDPVTKRPITQTLPQIDRFRPALEDSDPRSTYVNFASGQANSFWGWGSHVDWDVPELPVVGETRLELLGAFQSTEQSFDYDSDGTDLGFADLFTDRGAYQYSAELQWSGALGDRLEWEAGGLFAREKGYRDLKRPVSPITFSPEVFIEQDTENKNYGAWLSGTYSAGESVRLHLGGRYTKDVKRSYLLRSSPGSPQLLDRYLGCLGPLGEDIIDPATFRKGPALANPWCSDSYRGTMWGGGIDWRPLGSDDHLLFARIDRGYKSGGFRAGGRGEYKPETNWAYSAGSKSTFFDGRLQLNLDGFVYLYDDMQLVVLDELVLRTENTDARMYGWDLKAVATPIEGLRLEALLSNLHTETLDYFSLDPASATSFGGAGLYDPADVEAYNAQRLIVRDQTENYLPEDLGGRTYAESQNCLTPPLPLLPPPAPPPTHPTQGYRCGLTGAQDGLDDFSGNALSRAPEWKLTLSAEYEIPLGRTGSLTPRVQYSWQDDTYFRAFNRDFDLQEAYHLTDAKLIWTSAEQRWEAEVFVTNIEDEAPKQNLFIGARSNGAPPVVWWGPPRFYGFRVGFKY
jgi:iron complex outermembrane receptor protein